MGPFYPEGIRSGDRLRCYAGTFPTTEVNATFYSLPAPETLDRWRRDTPDDFVFACKASRFITHMKKLKDPVRSLARFLEAVSALGDRLGPLLFQLPPNWRPNPERLDALLASVPAGLRCAVEPRDDRWICEAIEAVLIRHGAALVVSDIDGRTTPVKATADFAYLRLHGPEAAYRGCYDDAALTEWARHAVDLRNEGRDVFVYFDNDEAGSAPLNARRLSGMVEGR